MSEIQKTYCCDGMKNESVFIYIHDNKIVFAFDWTAYDLDNTKYCPWCGKELSRLFKKKD